MNSTLRCVGLLLTLFPCSLSAQTFPQAVQYLSTDVANDVFYLPLKTDRYFTSGIRIEYGRGSAGPYLWGARRQTVSYWRLDHDLFTPEAIDSVSLQANDRPFASYLTLTRGKRFYDPLARLFLAQSWRFGILGKYSGGGIVQNAFHRMVDFADPIYGWRYEIEPDLIVNYRLHLRQRLPLSRRLFASPHATLRLGTLHTDLAGGLRLQWAVLTLPRNRGLSLRTEAELRAVGYNATLSGGLLNRDERYRGVIRPRRLVGRAGVRGVLHWGEWRLRGGISFLSREFRGGKPHVWAWFGVLAGFQPEKT